MKTLLQLAVIAFFAATFFIATSPANAASEISTGTFSSKAVSGYDTVAYFTEGKPVKGKSEFSTKHKGATWLFSSAANLEKFKANPDAYAPQYGGYCAWAAAEGYTASSDPDQWAIVDGKLYLNYNADVKKKWDADRSGFITKADANWPNILK